MQKRIDSFRYAINGFLLVIKSEINMRIHILASILTIIAGIMLKISTTEWMIAILCIALVWSAEIANTIIEEYLDIYHPEFNTNVGAIKDMSASAVLVVAVASGIIGLLIFVPKILSYI